MKTFYQLPKETKKRIFEQVATKRGLKSYAIEKDWWVVQVLRIISQTSAYDSLIFKGGTSLSKAWDIIDRFSEDVDLAIDHKILGFDEKPVGNKPLRRLRTASRKYLIGIFTAELIELFAENGITDIKIIPVDEVSSSADPTQIEIYYPNVIEYNEYLKPRVLLEIGSRSMMEPGEVKEISSLVYQSFKDNDFADNPINIFTVLPERTFLEKVFLLHEEFQKPESEIRVDRVSRHLYDLEKIMSKGYHKTALENKRLYEDIVNHRFTMTKMKDVDYSLHQPKTINIIPPESVIEDYKKDYNTMKLEMIHGEKLEWEDLILKIQELNKFINSQTWEIEIKS